MASSGCAFSFAVRAELIEAGAFSPPLGLSFSKPAYRPRTVRAEPVEALACWFDRHAWVEGGGRESPGVRVTFFCFAKRKSPKKRRPPVCDPCAAQRGKPAAGRLRGAPWNSLCAARAARTTTASQFTKHALRRACRPTPCAPRRIVKGTRESDIHSGRRCARPRLRSAWRLRP